MARLANPMLEGSRSLNESGRLGKKNHQGTTGLWFYLPGFHFRCLFLTHSQFEVNVVALPVGQSIAVGEESSKQNSIGPGWLS